MHMDALDSTVTSNALKVCQSIGSAIDCSVGYSNQSWTQVLVPRLGTVYLLCREGRLLEDKRWE
jgi:hypothetical protein